MPRSALATVRRERDRASEAADIENRSGEDLRAISILSFVTVTSSEKVGMLWSRSSVCPLIWRHANELVATTVTSGDAGAKSSQAGERHLYDDTRREGPKRTFHLACSAASATLTVAAVSQISEISDNQSLLKMLFALELVVYAAHQCW